MALSTVTNVLIACVGFLLVNAQSDGRYRPYGNDGRYVPDNAGKYSGTDGKYIHQEPKNVEINGKFGGFGSSKFGGVVSIGGNRPTTKPPATKPPSASAGSLTPSQSSSSSSSSLPSSSPPLAKFPPSPPFFLIDTRSNAVNNNQDDSSADEPKIKILHQEQEETADGYRYTFETENRILAEQSGQIKKAATSDEDAILRTTGFYQYIGDDGKQYRVDYVADENGFVAKGDHLPTPPPIPAEIQELLNTLATQQPDNA